MIPARRKRGSLASIFSVGDEESDNQWDETKEIALREQIRARKYDLPARKALQRLTRKHARDLDANVVERTLGELFTDDETRLARHEFLAAKNAQYVRKHQKLAKTPVPVPPPQPDPAAALRWRRRQEYGNNRRVARSSATQPSGPHGSSNDNSDAPLDRSLAASMRKRHEYGRFSATRSRPSHASRGPDSHVSDAESAFREELERVKQEAELEQVRMEAAIAQESQTASYPSAEMLPGTQASPTAVATPEPSSGPKYVKPRTSAASQGSDAKVGDACVLSNPQKDLSSATARIDARRHPRQQRQVVAQPKEDGTPSDLKLQSLEVVLVSKDLDREEREQAHSRALQRAEDRYTEIRLAFQRAQGLRHQLRNAVISHDTTSQHAEPALSLAPASASSEGLENAQHDMPSSQLAPEVSRDAAHPLVAKSMREIQASLETPLF